MRKVLSILIMFGLIVSDAMSAQRNVVARSARPISTQITSPTSNYTYNYMYPYLNNQMKTDLNPGVINSQSTNPINVITKTYQMPNTTARRVVSRPGNNPTATIQFSQQTPIARAAMTTPTQPVTASNNSYYPNYSTNNLRAAVANTTVNTSTTISTNNSAVSNARCYADYIDCMNSYCARPESPYNRCYCSSKLAQIDAKYQNIINDLILQIATLQGTNQWSDAEMNEYWESVISKYTGDNVWVNLDNALNIDWASLESRVRGQNAFNVGHEYCIQHLANCSYAAANLRDAYIYEINRDCANYEDSLIYIKNAAESIIATYK